MRFNHRTIRWLTAAMITSVVIIWPSSARPSNQDQIAQDHHNWEDQLHQLDPSRPIAYFELAEEISDLGGSQQDMALTRHLFGLAGALDPSKLGRSACLALIDLETDELVKQRLTALARLLDRRLTAVARTGVSKTDNDLDEAALHLSEAFSYYRSGQGPKALIALKKPGVRILFEAHQHHLRGGVKRFEEDCKHYRGKLRPSISDDDVTSMLRLERALLSGSQQTWSGQWLLTRGVPLAEVDPDRPQQTFQVDPTRPYFRHGRWVAFSEDREVVK